MRAWKLFVCLAFLTVTAGQIEAGLITDRNDVGSTDYIDWILPNGENAATRVPFDITSNGGIGVNVSSAGPTVRQLVEGSSWAGTFNAGDNILWTNDKGPDITLDFGSQGVTAIGTQIQADEFGPFVARITVFDGVGNQLATFTENGVASDVEGTAIFIGVKDVGDIHKITFTLDSAAASPNSFAINRVDFAAVVAVVPEPSSFALLGFGAIFVLASAFRRTSNR